MTYSTGKNVQGQSLFLRNIKPIFTKPYSDFRKKSKLDCIRANEQFLVVGDGLEYKTTYVKFKGVNPDLIVKPDAKRISKPYRYNQNEEYIVVPYGLFAKAFRDTFAPFLEKPFAAFDAFSGNILDTQAVFDQERGRVMLEILEEFTLFKHPSKVNYDIDILRWIHRHILSVYRFGAEKMAIFEYHHDTMPPYTIWNPGLSFKIFPDQNDFENVYLSAFVPPNQLSVNKGIFIGDKSEPVSRAKIQISEKAHYSRSGIAINFIQYYNALIPNPEVIFLSENDFTAEYARFLCNAKGIVRSDGVLDGTLDQEHVEQLQNVRINNLSIKSHLPELPNRNWDIGRILNIEGLPDIRVKCDFHGEVYEPDFETHREFGRELDFDVPE
tara:strand:+ start:462 stop:1610 length:1149 start_codon:yes stop_codon:yes gene_type:complete